MFAPFHRPEPLFQPRADAVDRRRDPDHYARRLAQGEWLRLVDTYGYGADILDALNYGLGPISDSLTGDPLRQERRRRRTLAAGLLVPVERGAVAIRGADPILLLNDLYRDVDRFWLPLVDIQALRTADRRFRQGVPYSVLGHALHPWYGTYAPKRTEHLELFGTWLSAYGGLKDTAIDVGTGCGVLAFMLARAGFADVRAVDVNPNAVESVRRDLARQAERPAIRVRTSNLLEVVRQPADLIVFNPPWIAGIVDDPLDTALFYDDDLFERFFDESSGLLNPQGKVVLVFSNVLTLLRPDLPHPIEAELERGRFVLDTHLTRRVRATRGRKTREKVEIWVLSSVEADADH
ncbi:MAG: hypothetical protein CL927_11155 [Deltaproteobacteria bacterium]|nr:hypothetical protein [Deltaproteobacteria bacterium]